MTPTRTVQVIVTKRDIQVRIGAQTVWTLSQDEHQMDDIKHGGVFDHISLTAKSDTSGKTVEMAIVEQWEVIE